MTCKAIRCNTIMESVKVNTKRVTSIIFVRGESKVESKDRGCTIKAQGVPEDVKR
ncbi:22303_t:CDS:2 [Rhizophagus irregularis]|nr:22303_t:CDS:2 [Rhizophagus irregularis]